MLGSNANSTTTLGSVCLVDMANETLDVRTTSTARSWGRNGISKWWSNGGVSYVLVGWGVATTATAAAFSLFGYDNDNNPVFGQDTLRSGSLFPGDYGFGLINDGLSSIVNGKMLISSTTSGTWPMAYDFATNTMIKLAGITTGAANICLGAGNAFSKPVGSRIFCGQSYPSTGTLGQLFYADLSGALNTSALYSVSLSGQAVNLGNFGMGGSISEPVAGKLLIGARGTQASSGGLVIFDLSAATPTVQSIAQTSGIPYTDIRYGAISKPHNGVVLCGHVYGEGDATKLKAVDINTGSINVVDAAGPTSVVQNTSVKFPNITDWA
jgi:hypothetical protein